MERVANTKWPPSPTQVRPGETAGKPDLGGLYEENQRLRREKAQARKEAAARARELEARSEIAQRRNSFLRAGGGFLKGVLEGRSSPTTEPPSTPPPQHCPSCKERLPCACTEPLPPGVEARLQRMAMDPELDASVRALVADAYSTKNLDGVVVATPAENGSPQLEARLRRCEDVLRMVEIARREGRRPSKRTEKSTNTQSPSSWVGCLSPDSMCEGADCGEYDCTGTLPDDESGVNWGELFGVSED